ncbi:MAG: FecR domain-containing protein [Gemmatimonadetes bacterium]|nr:FecR domain-containing protein [Gemmatimonadota bacterium]
MSDAPHVPDDLDRQWAALARFAAGESDVSEEQQVRAWLAAHPEDAALVALVKRRADTAAVRADAITVDTEAALRRVMAEVRAPARPALTVERGGARPVDSSAAPRRWRVAPMLAAAAVIMVAALAVWRRDEGAAAPREYRTAVGQRDSLRLPDGSTVVLAPGSRLQVAEGFGGTRRDVTLEGAAFFEVVHDDARPFTVHAAGAEIRDIGTAFSVKTEAGRVAVAVTHGIVAVRPEPTGAVQDSVTELHAGDRALLAGRTVQVQRGVVTADDVAWTRGQLSYRDAALSEVQADLARWYGIVLQVPDSTLARLPLTATFRADSADQVVRLVALALGADVVQRGDTVVLQPVGAGAPP